MTAEHRALRMLGGSFVAGMAGGAVLLLGIQLMDLRAAKVALDMGGDGLDLRAVVAVLWLFGNAAVFLRHVIPVLVRP